MCGELHLGVKKMNWRSCAFLGKPSSSQGLRSALIRYLSSSHGEPTASSETQATPQTTPTPSPPPNPTPVTPSRNHAPSVRKSSPPAQKRHPSTSKSAPQRDHSLEKMRKMMGSHSGGPVTLLGIECSCDDTGVGVVDERGRILGEALHSQAKDHQKTGGIVPHRASELHRENLERVTNLALEQSGRSLEEVAGIAVTVGPGLYSCLKEGIKFARKLAIQANKPLLPIHHMAAHALTPRLDTYIPFPYLVLLCSGGHCILAVAHSNHSFTTLGQALDDSPGEAFDKCARRLRLDLHPDLQHLNGGAALEKVAEQGDPEAVQLMKGSAIMSNRLCCNFSFAGIKEAVNAFVDKISSRVGWGVPLPMSNDVAAAFQAKVVDHIVTRTHRAILYLTNRQRKHSISTLVVSGGVASNSYLRSRLQQLTQHYRLDFHAPPPKLCTDNGVMIAWAGMERLIALETGAPLPPHPRGRKEGDPLAKGVCWSELDKQIVSCSPRLPLGRDLSKTIEAERIKANKQPWKKASQKRLFVHVK